jgi:D-serine deaminase-like pyridoxal phosphate-dependent protein
MYEIGFNKYDLETPAAVIDLDIMENNIRRMGEFFEDKNARLRAHTKVHRLPFIAHKQIEAGSKGICCQKVGTAEVMATSGIKDILISSQVVSPNKIDRMVALNKYTAISVPVDSVSNANLISKIALREGQVIDVLIDIHMGSNRCGIEPGSTALRLAKHINSLEGLNLIGLMGFEGHLSSMEPRKKRRGEVKKAEGELLKTKELLEKSDIEIVEISTGSTGTYDVTGATPGITEVQAGSYVLMAPGYHEHVPEFDCALTIVTSVISRPSEERIITDAGRMSNYILRGLPQVVGQKGLEVFGVHAENTLLRKDPSLEMEIGEKIEIYPDYLDGTMKLYDKVYGVRDDKVEIVLKTIGRDTSA